MKSTRLYTAGYILFILFTFFGPVFAIAQGTFTYNTACRNSNSNSPIISSGPLNPPGTFSTNPPNLPINPQTGQIFPNNSTPVGNYVITHSGTGQSAVVFVPPVGVANISPANVSLCQGNTVTLVATLSGVSPSTYSWNNGANSSQITVSPVASTTYSVNIQDIYGCSYSATRNVVVNSIAANLTTTSPTLCAGNSVNLMVNSSTPGMTYIWQPGNLSGQAPLVFPTVTTNYTVTATLSNCTKTATAKVTVFPAVTTSVNFNYPFPLCSDSGDPLPIKESGFTEGGTFFSDDAAVFVNPQTGKVKLAGMPAGEYVISYSISAQGCRNEVTSPTFLTFAEATQMTIGPNQVIEEGTGTIMMAGGNGEFQWEPAEGLNCSDCPSPYASPSKTTRYCVSDPSNGCNRGACQTIEVVCVNNGDLSLPTAFTPNKDSKNDRFCLKGWAYCSADFSVKIFNRWGQMVFSSPDANFCWDGTDDGQDLPAGVYVYSIHAVVNRAEVSKNGNITLIR